MLANKDSDLDGNARNLRKYHCKIKTLFAYLAANVIHKPPRKLSGAVGFTPSV